MSDTGSRGRSRSPKALVAATTDGDAEMRDDVDASGETRTKVYITGLSKNVAVTHLRAVFDPYGNIKRVDLPIYSKCKRVSSICIALN